MSDPQSIERELREYLEQEPNLRRDQRLEYLKLIFHKYLEIGKLEHLVNSSDLWEIMSVAKMNYSKSRLPMRVSRKEVDHSEAPHVSMIESVVSYLNRMNLLKRIVKIDYTE